MIDLENIKYLKDNSILIENTWLENSSNLVQSFTKQGDIKRNFITKVLAKNYDEERYCYHKLNVGDVVFLSRYSNMLKKFSIGRSSKQYSNVPPLQVQGVFRDNIVHLESLEILDDKVLIEKIEDFEEGNFKLAQTQKHGVDCCIGKVIKRGQGSFFPKWGRKKLQVEVGDTVLFFNNVSTPIMLDSKTYLCLSEERIVAKINGSEIKLDNLKMLNGMVLLKEVDEIIENGIIIGDHRILDEEEFEVGTRSQDRYKIVKVCEQGIEVSENVFSSNEGLRQGDVVIVNEPDIHYVYFKGELLYTCWVDDALCKLEGE